MMTARMMLRVFTIILVSSCGYAGNGSVLIEGNERRYNIPVQYIKDRESVISSWELKGDKARSLSLLIPHEILANSNNQEVAVLMFLDRDYGGENELAGFAKGLIRDSEVSKSIDGFRYVEELGDRLITYNLSFDPFSEKAVVKDVDYFLQIVGPDEIDIPGVKTLKPKITCRGWYIRDGILFQVSTSEAFCSYKPFGTLMEALQKIFYGWSERK